MDSELLLLAMLSRDAITLPGALGVLLLSPVAGMLPSLAPGTGPSQGANSSVIVSALRIRSSSRTFFSDGLYRGGRHG